MPFKEIVDAAQVYFPDLNIKYKDQSTFMKILGKILFFNPEFMTSYTTTIGSTVYFPNETFVKIRPVSASTILLHELVHVNDASHYTNVIFSFLYLFPQSLIPLCLPLFLISWKLALPLIVLFSLPLPSFFRMVFERRAYLASLYILNAFGKKLKFDPKLDSQKDYEIQQFKNSSYYFMWVFGDIDKVFNDAVVDINNGKRPYEDPVFDILDELIEKM